MEKGATRSLLYVPCRSPMSMFWKKATASAPMTGSAVRRLKSV